MESLLRVSEIHEKYLKDKINLIELYRVANNIHASKYKLIKYNNRYAKHYELEAFLQAFQEHEKKKRHKWRKYEGR